MASSEATKEVTVPVALLAVGLVLFAVAGLLLGGAVGAGVYLLMVAVQLVVGVPLGILACFITARILQGSFGYLNTAILKLAAIFVFCGAVAAVVPYVGWLISLPVYWGLLAWLFELEVAEVVVLTIVLWVVRLFVAGLVVGPIVAALQ